MLLFAVGPTALGASPIDEQLQKAIEPLIQRHKGEIAVAIRSLTSEVHYEFNADTPMPTASLIKLPILITAYRAADAGELELSESITLMENEKVPGSGVLTGHFSSGIKLPLLDYLRLMIRYSDNTATNLVADRIGLAATAREMERLGFSHTKLHSKVYRGDTTIFPERSRRFGIGSTTANEMVQMLSKLESGKLASEASTRAIREHLLSCDDSSKIAAGLGKETEFAHKTGAVANCRTDAGIIYSSSGPIAVCFLSNKNEDQSWSESNAANVLAARIGQIILERFGASSPDNSIREGSFGKTVEALQRTLNQRLDPTPNLAIDGDFGPATRTAVERFQHSHHLEATGVVEQKTWDALGPLIETDDPVPPPEVVNSEQLDVEPQRSDGDPPTVTARAWVIANPESGKTFFEFNGSMELEAASTTKIMTAYLVARYAEDHTNVLEEVVEFSEEADNTVGSTSGLRAGERATVNQLLYGLMLPSGNDAAVALAEHFGSRVTEGKLSSDRSSYDRFVHKMNRVAEELSLQQTHYVNPHGLSDERHVTSARDLAQLTSKAWRNDLLRGICATRQFGCTVSGATGYTRNIVWKNTNRLLSIAGYDGVKTGTTSAAGACLVAIGKRNGDKLMAIVLGSSSSPARYADARNLLHWAWRHRAANE